MKVVIEGCDGTGKTTLARRLAEYYGVDLCHVTNRDSNTFDFYRELIGKEDIIWDRNVIGEMIYPKVFNRKGNLDYIDFDYLINRSREAGTKYIILTASDDVIKNRLNTRGEPHKCVIDNIKFINGTFKNIAARYELPVIDTIDSPDEVFDKAIKIIEEENING